MGTNPGVRVELLLGADVYCKSVISEMRKDDRSGLMAINSKFGCLLNGPIPGADKASKINHSFLVRFFKK